VSPLSSPRTVRVDTQPPDTSSSSGSPPITFSSTEAGSTFECRLDAQAYEPCTSPRNYSAAPGTHTFQVRAIDPAGNVDPTPASATFTVSGAPSPPLTTPTITSPSSYSWSRSRTVTVSGGASAGATVEVLESGNSLGTTVATAGGTWSRQVTFSEGDQLVTARTRDAEGNTSPQSGTVVIRIDTQPPAAPAVTTPAAGSTNPSSFTLSGSAEPGTTVELFHNGVSIGTVATAYTGTWERSMNGMPNGNHAFAGRATDFAGNTSPVSATRTIRVGAGAQIASLRGSARFALAVPGGKLSASRPALTANRSGRVTVRLAKRSRAKLTLRLTSEAPERAAFARATARRRGTTTLRIKLTRAGRAALARDRTVVVALHVTSGRTTNVRRVLLTALR
jgi:hypothetical protein